MNNAEILGRTFFPGVRKEIKVQKIEGLRDREGKPSIKVDVTMPLADGKQVGMPTYIGDHYDNLCKEGVIAKYTKLDGKLEGMSLYIYELPESAEPSKTAISCSITLGTMTREKEDEDEGELGDVTLKYIIYVPGDKRLWTWLWDFNKAKLWIRHECTQVDIKPTEPKETQLPLGGEQFEAERVEATSKAHDVEFDAPAKSKTAKPKLVAAGVN